MTSRLFVLSIMIMTTLFGTQAAEKSKLYLEYISKYSKIAIREMKNNGIPASITLAQGLLESGAGQSELTKQSNNHFGIKCHKDWTGEKVYHDDDKAQECFRKYETPEESFADHSQFLKKARYSKLFELDPTDYKGWAKGLKACGYATDPRYADRLIDLIEWYGLNEFDNGVEIIEQTAADKAIIAAEEQYILESSMGSIPAGPYHAVLKIRGRKAVEARKGDTYESLAKEFGLRTWELRWYNKAHKGDSIEVGQPVYLRKW